ncbi:MAG: hypothetical protein WA661_04240 [Xanthobacteraceae bacterium]
MPRPRPGRVPHFVFVAPPVNSAMVAPAMPAPAPPSNDPLAEVTLADIGLRASG